jgi:hypothetical protein
MPACLHKSSHFDAGSKQKLIDGPSLNKDTRTAHSLGCQVAAVRASVQCPSLGQEHIMTRSRRLVQVPHSETSCWKLVIIVPRCSVPVLTVTVSW